MEKSNPPKKNSIPSQEILANQTWKPPPASFLKVNVDAATELKEQIAGLGAVIRDSGGN